jgi:PE-PPE domain
MNNIASRGTQTVLAVPNYRIRSFRKASMRATVVRSAGGALLIVVAVVVLAITSTMLAVFTLAATTTYIVGGTQFGFPFCAPFCGNLVTPQQNIDQAAIYVPAPLNPVVVIYPASFWPISAGYFLDPTYNQGVSQGVTALPPPATIPTGSVIFGYSQGAIVATEYKRNFNQYYSTNPNATPPSISFVLIGNGSRPNGGVMERFNGLSIPGLGFSFIGATPTSTAGATGITTTDIARQYDGFADFPTNPLNLLADANAMAGLMLVHPGYNTVNMSQAVFQGSYGDTNYYLIPTYPLPLLMPLQVIPVAGPVLVDMLDPVLRVLVEAGYNRTINPGQPTPANFLYFPNPATLATSVLIAIPTGLNLGLQDIMGTRTPGTPPPGLTGQGAYGIGGPPVTLPGQTPPMLPASLALTSTSTPQSASTTNASLFGSSGGLPPLLDPTTLMTDLASFSSFMSILNGGLPINIASLFSTPAGLPSLLNPSVLTEFLSAVSRNFPTLSQGAPMSIPSPTSTPAASSTPTSPLAVATLADDARTARSDTEQLTTHSDAGGNTPPSATRTTAASDDTPSTTSPTVNTESLPTPPKPLGIVPTGPRLNICRPSPCGASSPSGTTGSSPLGNGTATTNTSPFNGAVSAITGAVTNSLNAISSALGQHPGSGSSSSTGKP